MHDKNGMNSRANELSLYTSQYLYRFNFGTSTKFCLTSLKKTHFNHAISNQNTYMCMLQYRRTLLFRCNRLPAKLGNNQYPYFVTQQLIFQSYLFKLCCFEIFIGAFLCIMYTKPKTQVAHHNQPSLSSFILQTLPFYNQHSVYSMAFLGMRISYNSTFIET